jgi:hypothetical protein
MIAAKKTHMHTRTDTHRETETHMLLLLSSIPAGMFCKYLDIKALLPQIFSFLYNVS